MREDDKTVEHGRDEELERLRRAEAEHTHVEEAIDDEAHAEQEPVLGTHDREVQAELFGLVQAILRREDGVFARLAQLAPRDRRVMEALAMAVGGRDLATAAIVYAEDRSELLEKALAALQPVLVAMGGGGAIGQLEQMVAQVGELRSELEGLSDAQDADWILERREEEDEEEEDDEEGDDDGGDNDDDNGGVPVPGRVDDNVDRSVDGDREDKT